MMATTRGKLELLAPRMWGGCFNKVGEETVNIGSLITILCDREPGEPKGKNLIKVNSRTVELEDLGDSADCIFRRIYVLHCSTVRGLDHLTEQGNSLGGGRGKTRSTKLTISCCLS